MIGTLLLAWLCGAASGQDAPPATTVLHDVEVRVDGLLRLTERVTWTVRIDDPAECAFGVAAPAGLAGASDRGAVIIEDLLVVPAALPAGTVLTLRGQRSASPRLPHSGVLVGVPGLPAERTRLTVTTPLTSPLSVWADERARIRSREPRLRRVEVEWGPHDGERPALASYSTFEGWAQAGAAWGGVVGSLVGPGRDLGKAAAQDLAGVSVQTVVQRMDARLALDPDRPRGLVAARPTRELVDATCGSAAERAVLLVTMLQTAGYRAELVLARPVDAVGRFPVTVVAPYAYALPAVRVDRPDAPVLYLDPALPPGERGALPETLRGAEVWALGEVPQALPTPSLDDGRVTVRSAVTFGPGGEATLSAELTADGAADDAIRRLLGGLDEAGRLEAWSRLLRVGVPDAVDVDVTFEGVDDPDAPLVIRTGARHPGLLAVSPHGFAGTVPPLLGPALGAWLPPRLRVDEEVAVGLPADWQVLGASTVHASFAPGAEVSRALDRADGVERMHVEVRRPGWVVGLREEAAAVRFFEDQAREGLSLIVGVGGPGRAARRLSADRFTEADRAALEGLGWASAGRRARARASLRSAGRRLGLDRLVDAVERWAHPSDPAPWTLLERLTHGDDPSAVTVLEALARIGAVREARRLAGRLVDSPDPTIRVRAQLVRIRLLDGPDDAGLALADQAARQAGAALGDRERWRLALAWVASDGLQTSSAWSASLRSPDAPAARAVALAVRALQGAPRQQVIDEARALLREAPSDLDVLFATSEALRQVGRLAEAAAIARTAARRSPKVPALWDAAVDRALAAGDLPLALDAAGRASALVPDDDARAERVIALAFALGDPGRVIDTYDRLGRTLPIDPPALEERLASLPGARLAVLQVADLTDAPDLLADRARRRLADGDLEEAARDGVVLAERHGRADGLAIAFAAMAGRQVSSSLTSALDAAARSDADAQLARLEHALVTDPDPAWLDVAWGPRAERLAELVERSFEAPGWTDSTVAVRGVRARGGVPDPVLGAHPAVQAWSDPDEPAAVLQVAGVPEALPPPLGLLYELAPRAELRRGDLEVRRLLGGLLPMYVARREIPGFVRLGLGFTIPGAQRALDDAWPPEGTAGGSSLDVDNR